MVLLDTQYIFVNFQNWIPISKGKKKEFTIKACLPKAELQSCRISQDSAGCWRGESWVSNLWVQCCKEAEDIGKNNFKFLSPQQGSSWCLVEREYPCHWIAIEEWLLSQHPNCSSLSHYGTVGERWWHSKSQLEKAGEAMWLIGRGTVSPDEPS